MGKAGAPQPTRRSIVKGAAWSLPLIATAAGAPHAEGSVTVPPGTTMTASRTAWPSEWNKDKDPDGDRRPGGEQDPPKSLNGGNPVANVAVTFRLTSRGDKEEFWFVSDPTVESGDLGGQTSITLFTDADGKIALDSGPTARIDANGRYVG